MEYGLETDNSDMSEDDATTLGDMSESESEIEVRTTIRILLQNCISTNHPSMLGLQSEEEEDSDADEGLKEMSAPVKRNDDLKVLIPFYSL